MKQILFLLLISVGLFTSKSLLAQTNSSNSNSVGNSDTSRNIYIDVHDLEPGKVKYSDVLAAHKKDLAIEGKYGVNFIKFWVDEKMGKVYCLSTARDSNDIIQTHREAHGLIPSQVQKVDPGTESATINGKKLFLDIHHLGAGNVTLKAVADAHQKDLDTEKKFGVNFINYWVDQKKGIIYCLSEAPDANAVIQTHKMAHGLLPDNIMQVKQGN